MSTAGRPRHSRKEIRDFADELDRGGWKFETVDSSGHTVWSHPKASGTYKLPETPRHFSVRRARYDVARLLGQSVAGKRTGKTKAKAPRRDFTLQVAQKAAAQRETDREKAERAARQRAEQIRAARARQQASAQSADAEYRRERFYADLMRPGTGR